MKQSRNKIPRILYLKILYGDDFIDYIKDEYGVDNFLHDVLEKEDSKTHFLKDDPEVREFSAHWFILTDYYKKEFGKEIRDKDAVGRLINIRGFKNISKLYKFRCELFKADFALNDKFRKKLTRNLILLKRTTSNLLAQKCKKNKYLIENSEW